MRKPTIIKHIQRIIREWGAFGSGEVAGSSGEIYSPCVDSMGDLVALGENFDSDGVEVNVYNPSGFSSDPINTFNVSYEDLDKKVLLEILTLAEQYEADQLKTEKRCAN